ncbi:uncharacterized protein LOC134263594 [Saccostrea cucullata]|uniref:uncharacterized protein LOC134263594 n=1 Tax=Saccostrea cuccullata TaxID=36930 RepID=UPI002ED080FA
MYAFVTECLVEERDLKFFLTIASLHVIAEYCWPWEKEKCEGERCLYVPLDLYDFVINKQQTAVIKLHRRMLSDSTFRGKIIDILKVPQEVLEWGQKARERYTEYANKGTQTIHHARGMIVGCAAAGKTTLLKRLLGRSEEEILNVTSTEGLEVHEETFEVCDKTLRVNPLREVCYLLQKKKNKYDHNVNQDSNRSNLSFFDFGGQCAYYACHQIYLTRRAFYVVVVDASKPLDQIVDKEVCDQADTVFADWTYNGTRYGPSLEKITVICLHMSFNINFML